GPAVVRHREPVLVRQVDRVHEFAEDVELELLVRGIADAHWARAPIAVQVGENLFFEFAAAVDAVDRLKWFLALVDRGLEPAPEPGGLLGEADPDESVDH